MPTITGSYTTAYSYVRDRGDAEVKAEAARALVSEIMRGNKVRFSQTKDPVSEQVTVTAALDLADGPPWTQTRQPQTLDEIFAQIEDPFGEYRLSEGARQTVAAYAKPTAPAPQPVPDTNKLEWAREARKQTLTEVAAALDAVEADLLSDTDPAFVLVLLRERLKSMAAPQD